MFTTFKHHTCYSNAIMPQMTEALRNQMIGQLQVGTIASVVARTFNVNKRTVFRIKAKFNQTGTTKNWQKSGRPSKTTPAENRIIVLNHLRNRFRTAEKTKCEFNALPNVNRVSVYTVRRRLHAAGLKCRQLKSLPSTWFEDFNGQISRLDTRFVIGTTSFFFYESRFELER